MIPTTMHVDDPRRGIRRRNPFGDEQLPSQYVSFRIGIVNILHRHGTATGIEISGKHHEQKDQYQ
jgi:hypothetical protein